MIGQHCQQLMGLLFSYEMTSTQMGLLGTPCIWRVGKSSLPTSQFLCLSNLCASTDPGDLGGAMWDMLILEREEERERNRLQTTTFKPLETSFSPFLICVCVGCVCVPCSCTPKLQQWSCCLPFVYEVWRQFAMQSYRPYVLIKESPCFAELWLCTAIPNLGVGGGRGECTVCITPTKNIYKEVFIQRQRHN